MLLGLLTMPNDRWDLSIKSLHVVTGHCITVSTYLCITDDRPLGSKPATVGTCTIRQKARKAEQGEK
ncbi:unnamed protein product [Fusarium fujikuroi]|uniref:Uncharacterized protein n=1 Tax=Fusarium fujikuroi TaxID=5127 RepID=A0A9Q9U6V5_FUSFU|nr:unnamed protein product [Fusarium fujikuroi]VTT66837.1 unnamed protein product [Fusarium fujikuroi]VZH91050.1 unnamed protein product [Fusarium fujikuroi]